MQGGDMSRLLIISAALLFAAAAADAAAVADLASSAFSSSCYSDLLRGRPMGSLSNKPILKIISYLNAFSWGLTSHSHTAHVPN